jgi:TonB family protein
MARGAGPPCRLHTRPCQSASTPRMADDTMLRTVHPVARIAVAALATTFYCFGQTAASFVQNLVGQRLLLSQLGDQPKTKLKKSHLNRIKGSCDVAVLVKRADLNQGTLRFQLENAGTPSIRGQRASVCHYVVDEIALEVSGFAPDETTSSISGAVSKLLQSPEEYLVSGIHFSIPPGPDDETPVKQPPALLQYPKVLLSVDGTYTPQARSARRKGTVTLSCVVGSDGRAHKVRLLRGLGLGLDENAIRVFSFWRFDPARQSDKTVATETKVEMHFDIM